MPSLPRWISSLRDSECESTPPPCGDPDCTSQRRLWRRLRWRHGTIRLDDSLYCAPVCFEAAARQRLIRLCAVQPSSVPQVRHRIPLGLLMISRGQLTNQQLRSALEAQRTSGSRRLGEWLEKLGFATEQQIVAALAQQWACPVLTPKVRWNPNCLQLLPYPLLEASGILPIQFVAATRTFHLAFCNGIDYGALYAIEQMLDCQTQPCLATRSAVANALVHFEEKHRPEDLLFEGWRDAADVARITCGYVLKLGVATVRLVSCGAFIWARLSTGLDIANLLFRQATPASAVPACGATPVPFFSL